MKSSRPSSALASRAAFARSSSVVPSCPTRSLHAFACSSARCPNHAFSDSCCASFRSYLRAISPVIVSIICFCCLTRIRSKTGARSRISGWVARKTSSGVTGRPARRSSPISRRPSPTVLPDLRPALPSSAARRFSARFSSTSSFAARASGDPSGPVRLSEKSFTPMPPTARPMARGTRVRREWANDMGCGRLDLLA